MRYKIYNFITFAVCFMMLVTAMTLAVFSHQNYSSAAKRIVAFDDNNLNSLYLRVMDIYGQENQQSLHSVFREKDSLDRFKKFNANLKQEFDYLEFDKQNLHLLDQINYSEEFRVDYGNETYGMNDAYGIDLKSFQIEKNTYRHLSLNNSLSSGRGFSNDDFTLSDANQTVCAILGEEYSDYSNIGDVIHFEYLSKQITVQVIGFFKPNTVVTLNNEIFSLDQSIVIPFFDINYQPINDEDAYFQKIVYSLKNWGYIKVDNGDDILEYRAKVNRYNYELNLKYIVNDAYIYENIKNISHTLHSSKGVLLIASLILLSVMTFLSLFIYIWNYNKNRKNYSIHLISGCSLSQLKFKIFSKIFLQFALSLAISYFINLFLLTKNSIDKTENYLLQMSFFQVGILTALIMLVMGVVLNRYINKNNILVSTKQD